MKRRITRQLQLGSVFIGGDAPVSVQSMTNTRTDDAAATLKQIKELAAVGCDVIRCAVPDMPAAQALREIVAQSQIPVIADIHFDYKLALAAIDAGVNGLRLNPGNIGGREKVEAVVAAARIKNIPIRIGVNAGSLPKDLLEKYGHPTAEALVEAAWRHIHILEELDYRNIKISLGSPPRMAACVTLQKFMPLTNLLLNPPPCLLLPLPFLSMIYFKVVLNLCRFTLTNFSLAIRSQSAPGMICSLNMAAWVNT